MVLTRMQRQMLALQRRMLSLLAEQERVVTHELSASMGLSDEELLVVAEPLSEKGFVRLCLSISGGPNWWEITPRGREILGANEIDARL